MYFALENCRRPLAQFFQELLFMPPTEGSRLVCILYCRLFFSAVTPLLGGVCERLLP